MAGTSTVTVAVGAAGAACAGPAANGDANRHSTSADAAPSCILVRDFSDVMSSPASPSLSTAGFVDFGLPTLERSLAGRADAP
jgi:hypothetical protein